MSRKLWDSGEQLLHDLPNLNTESLIWQNYDLRFIYKHDHQAPEHFPALKKSPPNLTKTHKTQKTR